MSSLERSATAGCATFPRNNAFNANIADLEVLPDSAATIQAIGRPRFLAGFSSGIWEGSRMGLPVNELDARTAPTQDLLVGLDHVETSDADDVPWPSDLRFEGWPGRAWDKHVLIVDSSSCRTWEAINVQPPGENVLGTILGRWYADKIVSVDLASNHPRPGGAVTAAGLSMLAGLVRFDEVASGRIGHVLTMTLPNVRTGKPVWPSFGSDGTSTNPASPPMGSWFRLKSDADLSGLGPQARVIARAMRDHGVVLVDTGANASISGEPDTRWDDKDLATLSALGMGDFEVVDASPMMVSRESLEIR